MFKVDFVAVHGAALAVVDAAEGRLPLNVVVDEVEKRGVSLGEDGEVILRAICAASTVLDLRAGRSGGVGRREWFKGGRSTVEPTGAAAKLAKRIREEHGSALPQGEEREAATRAANRYLEALAGGECEPMPLAEVLKRFGG